jgi:hypothetical protein
MQMIGFIYRYNDQVRRLICLHTHANIYRARRFKFKPEITSVTEVLSCKSVSLTCIPANPSATAAGSTAAPPLSESDPHFFTLLSAPDS